MAEKPEKGSTPFSGGRRFVKKIPKNEAKASRKTRKPSMKCKCRLERLARGPSCALRCESIYHTCDNPCSCWCPLPSCDLLSLQSSVLLPWSILLISITQRSA